MYRYPFDSNCVIVETFFVKLLRRLKPYFLFPVRFIISMIIKRPPIIHVFETEHHLLIDKSLTVVIWKVERASWVKITNIGIVDLEGYRVVENSKLAFPLAIKASGYKFKVKAESIHKTINIDTKTEFKSHLKNQPSVVVNIESVVELEKSFMKHRIFPKIETPHFKNVSNTININTNEAQEIIEKVSNAKSIEELTSLEILLKS